MNINLFVFNNYFNRIVLKHDTLQEYIDHEGSILAATFSNINFNPNDGVSTELVVNYNGEYMPDYLIAVNEDGTINSRWYIIESARTRAQQFRIQLYRDLIADFYTETINAVSFIEKARVGIYDTAIFNNEDMSFNQIKKSEFKIKDRAGCGWYVAYLAKNITDEISLTIASPSKRIAGTFASQEEFDANYRYASVIGSGKKYYTPPVPQKYGLCYYGALTRGYYEQSWDRYGNPTYPETQVLSPSQVGSITREGTPGLVYVDDPYNNGEKCGYRKKAADSWSDVGIRTNSTVKVHITAGVDFTDGEDTVLPTREFTPEEILGEIGKVYRIGDKFYEITLDSSIDSTDNVSFTSSATYAKKFINIAENNYSLTDDKIEPIGFIEYTYNTLATVLVERPEYAVTVTLSPNRVPTADAPYDLIAIPCKWLNTEFAGSTNEEMSKALVDELIIKVGQERLYDVQLLPYAPYEETMFDEYGAMLDDFPNTDKDNYQVVGTEPGSITVMLFPQRSSFEKAIYQDLIEVPTDPIEFKVANECDKYRLVSPNYNGQFEFSATKNRGVSAWLVSYTYKPYTPYIRVAPEFGGLYGEDFKDARGLICGGDFSISQISSAWVSYEVQNKNYQTMFDRQIQNLEINNSVQRTREIVGAAAGTLQGAASGAVIGMMSGNPSAAAVGATAGGIASGVAGIADVYLNEKLRREGIDYTKDQFGYNLQNIRALPYNLTKVGSQNEDFKLFPFIEHYACTEIEKQALRDKITYNGMTVMRIGRLIDFILDGERTYIKSKLIRISVVDDYHIANKIAKELNEGVYI